MNPVCYTIRYIRRDAHRRRVRQAAAIPQSANRVDGGVGITRRDSNRVERVELLVVGQVLRAGESLRSANQLRCGARRSDDWAKRANG